METIFNTIEQVEDQMRKLRELVVDHSKELALATGSMAGRRLDGKPDRRWRAAKRKHD